MIRKFFKTITEVLDGILRITKNIFFFLVGGETLIFVCSYGCVVGPCYGFKKLPDHFKEDDPEVEGTEVVHDSCYQCIVQVA